MKKRKNSPLNSSDKNFDQTFSKSLEKDFGPGFASRRPGKAGL